SGHDAGEAGAGLPGLLDALGDGPADRLGEKGEPVRELLAERMRLPSRLDQAADAELGGDDLITTEADPEVAVRLGAVAALLRRIEAVVTTRAKVGHGGAHRGRVVLGSERPAPYGRVPGGNDQPVDPGVVVVRVLV